MKKTVTIFLLLGCLISSAQQQSSANNMFWITGNSTLTANTAAINTTETKVLSSGVLPANKLAVGTRIKITLAGTCTTTLGNTSTFAIRIGTAGTVADALLATITTGASALSGTAVPFKAIIEISVRTVGASATIGGSMALGNNGILGISVLNDQVLNPAFSSFNSTTANLILTATYKSAAITTTSTFVDGAFDFIYN